MSKPLSKLKKMSPNKSERFYFKKNDGLESEVKFDEAYSVSWIEKHGYYRTGWVDLSSRKHTLLKKASEVYGVEFIPEKMFMDKKC